MTIRSKFLSQLYPSGINVPVNATEQERLQALIEAISAYVEYFHGGAVEMQSYDGETLKVKFSGACLGCPLSQVTLHGWVEGTVRQFFPNLKAVEAV